MNFSSFTKIFKRNPIKAYKPLLEKINKLEEAASDLSDIQLKSKTSHFKNEIAEGATLDSILPEAFAVAREASKRALGMRPFDVQILGAIALHKGAIAEMKTGEGKTLVATLTSYLNALSNKGVHVVTVNDYLAQRDANWMGDLHRFLGLTVGCVQAGMDDQDRKNAYACDITYATNNELGFDYLRDNMKFSSAEVAQRGHAFAIIDEVDAILIDEARTPLVISAPSDEAGELFLRIHPLIKKLGADDLKIDEENKTATLSEKGEDTMEKLLVEADLIKEENDGLYSGESATLVHAISQSLKANMLFKIDKDYVIKDGQVAIVDEFTGRIMEGRRYSDGLHQALEVKEGVEVKKETQTLASITFQNYFRLYKKLAGMTGTAATEAKELREIYNLEVIEVPTNKPVIRNDMEDEVYATQEEKLEAIAKTVKEANAKGQPVLLGTESVEKSELISDHLKKHKIKHEVLNARQHEKEAGIIAQAGRLGAVTIATNMAGRGTDIKLGGNPSFTDESGKPQITEKASQKEKELVLKAGGLFVLGTARHESRRIDNQLRGRSGRQGDAGCSKFYLSLEDDLMRIFASDKVSLILKKLGMEKGEALVHPWISKALENAQKKIEARNYDIRKSILRYDNILNEQRSIIYEERRQIMEQEDLGPNIATMRDQIIDSLFVKYVPDGSYKEQWKLDDLEKEFGWIFNVNIPTLKEMDKVDVMKTSMLEALSKKDQERDEIVGKENIKELEKSILLQVLDSIWREHIVKLEYLRKSIGLRAYAQKDPLSEYKKEGFLLFDQMLEQVRLHTVRLLSSNISKEPQEPVRRNAPCPCGSGKRYKHCHGST